MKKQIRFKVEEDKYVLTLDGPENTQSFEVSREGLSFDTMKFYETFFKGLNEKPEYEVCLDDADSLDKNSRVIFEELSNLVQEICEGIDASWFK